MKKLLFIILLITAYQSNTHAQVDVQINPIALLFGGLQASIEAPLGQNGGAELNIIGIDGDFGLIGLGKYYMKPDLGADKFYIGAFVGLLFEDGAGGGFMAGYKWLSEQGLNFELALGIGRGTGDIEVLPYAKLAVGYRFGQKD